MVVGQADRVRCVFPRHGGTNDGRLYFVEYRMANGNVELATNVDWFKPKVADPRAPTR